MTISSALNSAMSGLHAASRASGLVSSNIANALTPGYARRTLSISSASIGNTGGVQINGINRQIDLQVIADRRLAGSEFGYRAATSDYLNRIENLIGTPDQLDSLSGRLASFENNLILASSRPDATERLDSAALGARDLARSINSIADGIQSARTNADRSIADQVTRLNDALQGVQKLNARITAASGRQNDTSGLQDQRQVLIDQISEMVPVRMLDRDHGAVALYSTGGAILLDGRAAEIGFEPSNVVTPFMSITDGTLSGLTINGYAVNTTSTTGRLHGGTLGAQFEIRDELAPQAQVQIDAVARDMIERFESSAVDPTLAVGQAGLFTDSGAALDPAFELGLANRIALNELVDPAQGGQTWRMRDGLGAVAPGLSGDATLLNALSEALTDARITSSGSFGSAALSATGVMAGFASQIGATRLREDQQLSFASAQFYELTELELANGVDTDVELQNLMVIEQAYAANARVIETVDQMFDELLRI
ncbi:flagellar hook-associated protein FlgK [uncultured Tateyamaria sp.]|uniref:flagellar hook-associated protein FlgK n=1 Tax=uncultured Tateyamaria sp. TaxID=455651 RepID=UPI0026282C20|nr:flagellar hook-associated protein FlgK [uncultured Tateyamaria sp.]